MGNQCQYKKTNIGKQTTTNFGKYANFKSQVHSEELLRKCPFTVSSAPDKNQLQQIARSAARCSRARVGARAPRLRGETAARVGSTRLGQKDGSAQSGGRIRLFAPVSWTLLCHSAPRRAALLGTFVHTQRTSRLGHGHGRAPHDALTSRVLSWGLDWRSPCSVCADTMLRPRHGCHHVWRLT